MESTTFQLKVQAHARAFVLLTDLSWIIRLINKELMVQDEIVA